MPDENCPMPEPGPEHAQLMQSVGAWNVACTYFMDPSQPPMEIEAKETIEALGPFWTVSLFECDMMGMPFRGRATTGYDPKREKWIGTWIDSMSPHIFQLEGRYDDEGRILTMEGEGPMPGMDGLTKYRSTNELVGPDERKFEMFCGMPDGNEHKMFSYVYTRA